MPLACRGAINITLPGNEANILFVLLAKGHYDKAHSASVTEYFYFRGALCLSLHAYAPGLQGNSRSTLIESFWPAFHPPLISWLFEESIPCRSNSSEDEWNTLCTQRRIAICNVKMEVGCI
jgi:hypothetical protein